MGAMEMCIRGDHELLWLALQVEKTMKEIIDDLGLEINGTKKSSAIRTIDRNIRVT